MSDSAAQMLIEAPANKKAIKEMVSAEIDALETQYDVKIGENENITLTEKRHLNEE